MLQRALDILRPGGALNLAQRVQLRRDHAYLATLCLRAVERMYNSLGAPANNDSGPLQRYWRDVHVGQAHAIHVPGTVYHASALSSLGVDPQGPLRAMI